MIAVIDYGMGNLGSVERAMMHLGYDVLSTNDAKKASTADGLILPGVGAMSEAMRAIKDKNFDRLMRDYILSGRPFLAICLGMQMLFLTSQEGKTPVEGLGIFKGDVARFPDTPGLLVPQIGWNQIKTSSSKAITVGEYVYFAQSYYCRPADQSIVAATAHYGIDYACAVEKDNLLATQFHPEKSGEVGLSILSRWARRTR